MFVGRKQERSALTDHLYEALHGKGKVVFIAGEAGLGKTTLVEHWWETVSADFGQNMQWDMPVFAKASCSIPVGGMNVGELEALQPFADLLSSMCAEAHADEKKFKKVSDILMEAAPDWLSAVPVVGKLAAAGMKTYNIYKKNKKESKSAASNAVNQQQVFQQYVNFLIELSNKSSAVVIWIDDLHWADTSSLNLLFYLARQISAKPVLVIVTYRPEETVNKHADTPLLKIKNEITRYELGKNISLNYFTPEEVNVFLENTFKNYRLNKKFEDWLLKISGGNALFITNYVKTLVEDGLINKDGVVSEDYKNLKPPETVKAVIEERIMRMDEDVTEMLRYATAEGEEFTTYIVAKITGKGALEIIKTLKKAEGLNIIKNSGSVEVYSKEKTTLYHFLHALFYNALYESLNEEEKLILHRQCFQTLKEEWDKNKNNILLATKLLAHAEKCCEYYAAGEIGFETALKLWEKFAHTEALEIMRRIIDVYSEEIKQTDADLFEKEFKPKILSNVMYNAAEILSRTGDFDKAYQMYEAVTKLYDETGNTEGKVWALNGIAFVMIRFNRLNESIEYANRAYKLAEEADSLRGKLVSLNHTADATWALGDTDGAIEILKQCVELNKATGDKLTQCFFLYAIGSLYQYKHSLDEAEKYVNQSLELARELNAIKYEANALGIDALIKAERGEYTQALNVLNKVLDVQVTSKDRHAEAWTLNKIGQVQRDLENYPEAIKNLKQSYEIFKEINNPGETAKSLMYLGNTFRVMDKLDESYDTLAESLSLAENMENKLLKGLVLGELAYTEEKRSNIEKAVEHLTRSVEILKSSKYPGAGEYESELERIKKLL